MRQTLHQHSATASIEVRSFNAISVRLCPVKPRVICGDAVGPANSLRHYAGDVRTVHPAPVDARRVIAPVSPKHQAVRENTQLRGSEDELITGFAKVFLKHQITKRYLA